MSRVISALLVILPVFLFFVSHVDAQGIQIEYKKKTSNSELNLTYSSGSYWGSGYGSYGSGYYYGTGPTYFNPGWARQRIAPLYRYHYRPSYPPSSLVISRPIYHYAPLYTAGAGLSGKGQFESLKECEEGLRELRKGNYASSVVSLKKAVLFNPDSPRNLFYFGIALAGLGDRMNALKAVEASLEKLDLEDLRHIEIRELLGSELVAKSFYDSLAGSGKKDLLSACLEVLFGNEKRAIQILTEHKKNAAARRLLRFLKS